MRGQALAINRAKKSQINDIPNRVIADKIKGGQSCLVGASFKSSRK
jgi:hypothetical protein